MAGKPVHPWIEVLGRVGYATKGAIYTLIGVIAAATAVRARRGTTDTEGALLAVLSQPFGGLFTFCLAVGLAAYGVWRLAQCIFDAEGKGVDLTGLATRFGFACSGLVHIGLAWSAFKLAMGLRRDNVDLDYEGTFMLLRFPFGTWLVAAAGLGLIGFGVSQIYLGNAQKCRERLATRQMTPGQLAFTCRAAQLGLTARGIVFSMIGWFLLTAARENDATEAGGLAEALETLEQQPYGPALLGAVAAGFIAYGLYMFVESRFHRIRVE